MAPCHRTNKSFLITETQLWDMLRMNQSLSNAQRQRPAIYYQLLVTLQGLFNTFFVREQTQTSLLASLIRGNQIYSLSIKLYFQANEPTLAYPDNRLDALCKNRKCVSLSLSRTNTHAHTHVGTCIHKHTRIIIINTCRHK